MKVSPVDLTDQLKKPQRGERAEINALKRSTQIRNRTPRGDAVSLGGRTLEGAPDHELLAFSEVLDFMKTSLFEWDSSTCSGEIFTIDKLRYCDIDLEFLSQHKTYSLPMDLEYSEIEKFTGIKATKSKENREYRRKAYTYNHLLRSQKRKALKEDKENN